MLRSTVRFLLSAGLLCAALPAFAVAPGLLFAPPPNQVGTDVFFDALPNDESIEISEDPLNPGDGGAGQGSLTTLNCTIGGDDNIQFVGIPSFQFQGNVSGGASIDLSCDPQPAPTSALVSCNEKRGLTPQPPRDWDVVCPAAGAAAPELEAVPASGTTLTIVATQPTDAGANVTISNSGSATLNITSATGLAAPFSIAPLPPTAIGPGGAQLYTITCDAAAPGVFVDELTLASNDADEPTVSYPVSCTVNAPAGQEFDSVPAAPGPLDLANTAGSPPTTASATITNVGSGTLTVSIAAPLAAPLSAVLGSGSLAGGASTDLTVSCSSAGAASSSQTLTLNTNDPDDGEATVQFQVSCNVTAAPQPEFSSTPGAPGPISITTPQGTNGTAQINVTNVGSANLTVNVTSSAAPITTTGALNLAPGASGALTVSCSGTTAGTFNGRTVLLSTNDSSEASVSYTVNCTVTAGASSEFSSSPVAPGPLTITTNQGVTGSASVSITNIGNANLLLSPITALPQPTFSFTPAAPITIVPGASQVVSARCFNNTPGDYSGSLVLTTNDPDDGEGTVVFNVNCRVNLVAPEYSSSPSAGATFVAYAAATETVNFTVRISNIGNAVLSYSLSGLSGALSSTPAIGGPYSLNAGFTQNIVLSCDGSALVSSVVQNLSVTHNDVGESPALYRIDCRRDIRVSGVPLLKTLLGTGLLTDPADLLFQDGFE